MREPLRHTWEILRKDVLIELRAGTRTFALFSFVLTLLLLFSFAVGPDAPMLRAHAPAYLWMALLLASTLLLARSFQIEVESGALDALVLAPLALPALFYGKALANAAQLIALGLVALPAVIALYDVKLVESPIWLGAVLVLGSAGLAAPGTLYAALTARIQGRQLLLPLLLFPLIVPCLLASVKATALVLTGDPLEQLQSWVSLLVAFDLLFWSLCGALFPRVVEA
jgi:heme exporter protein B